MAILSHTTRSSTCWSLRARAAIASFCVSTRTIVHSTMMQHRNSSRVLARVRWLMCTSKPGDARLPAALSLIAGCAFLLGACRQQMFQQPSYRPYQPSGLFADGSSARSLPAGTVARGQLRDDPLLFTGKDANGQDATEF